MATAVRKQAPRLARPAARYWKGKAPKGVADVDSDSDVEREPLQVEDDGDVPVGGEQDIIREEEDDDDRGVPARTDAQASGYAKKSMNVALKNVNISNDGKVIVAGREESGRTLMEVDGQWSSRSLPKM
jgi:microfibrillar-associated protein 1